MKKMIGICLTAVLCFGLCISSFAMRSETADVLEKQTETEQPDVATAPWNETRMAKSVIDEAYGNLDGEVIDWVGEFVAGDNFGGLYLDENENLVVNLIHDVPQMAAFEEKAVRFAQVQYSLSELSYVADILVPYMLEYDIALLDANDITNQVDICLLDFSEESIEAVMSILKAAYPVEYLEDMVNLIDWSGAVVCGTTQKAEENPEQMEYLE